MNKVTNALLLKDEAPRSHVAIAYGLIGLVVGAFVLSNK
ncbi:P10 membrane protein [Pseudomonas phage phi13]|uniref:p10 n=1 Tax=Pseudomonas phage phi13 TaxID=134554 RepID=Q9FZT8_9VIRU|nr:P10 membrane protein [Pseudomonas phage phi13]AAG00438.1 P10 [Pseudomonas phage phi13]